MSDTAGQPAGSSAGGVGEDGTTNQTLRTDGGVRGRGGSDGVEGAIKLGVAAFGVLAAGVIVTSLVASLLSESGTVTAVAYTMSGTDNTVFAALAAGYSRIVNFGILLAVVLGVFLAQTASTAGGGAIRGAAGNGVGAGLTLVVLAGLLLLTAPGNANPDAVDLLEPAAAVTAGTIVAGGGAGYATVALRED